MKLLREYVREMLDRRYSLMVPSPPPEDYRVKELAIIQNQYHNRYNPNDIQDALDSIAESFDTFLVSHGLCSQEDLLKQLTKEVLPIIYFHKKYFNSLRPKDLARKYNVDFKCDYIKSAQSPSYPSGHAAQAHYIALMLSNLYPELKEGLAELANMISQARLDRGVHFPSDIIAGKLLAVELIRRSS